MAFKLAHRTRELVVTEGDDTVIDLGGVLDDSHQTFDVGIGTGNSTYYVLLSGNGVDWEVGTGSVPGAGQFSRDTVRITSAGGTTRITLEGESRVWSAYPADPLLLLGMYATTDKQHLKYDAGSGQFLPSLDGYFTAFTLESQGAGTLTVRDFGDASYPDVTLRSARGTILSPSAVLEDDILGGLTFYSHDGTDWELGAALLAEAAEDWDTAGHGTRIVCSVVPAGTTTPVDSFIVWDDGGISAGGAPSMGLGTINMAGIYLLGEPVALSSDIVAVSLSNAGAWNGANAYSRYDVVSRDGSYFVATTGIPAPSAVALAVDGTAHATWDNASGVTHTIALTTSETADTIVVQVMVARSWGTSSAVVSSVDSPTLTFTRRAQHTTSDINHEVWTAPAVAALAGEVITIVQSAGCTGAAIAFGVSGADTSAPFDANVALPATAAGAGTAPSGTHTTTTAVDILLFFDAATGAGFSGTAPTGWTAIDTPQSFNFNGATALAAYYKAVTATQSAAAVAGSGTPAHWSSITDAVAFTTPLNPTPDRKSVV